MVPLQGSSSFQVLKQLVLFLFGPSFIYPTCILLEKARTVLKGVYGWSGVVCNFRENKPSASFTFDSPIAATKHASTHNHMMVRTARLDIRMLTFHSAASLFVSVKIVYSNAQQMCAAISGMNGIFHTHNLVRMVLGRLPVGAFVGQRCGNGPRDKVVCSSVHELKGIKTFTRSDQKIVS